ncbi:MAG: sugar phosphate nucleotidyltransferase [bacterium]|nr:sugar phosphate nucleotidyltransferase [bacterium]
MSPFSVVILAAGIGKRMKTKIPKVMHLLCGKPILSYVIETAKSLNPSKIVVVVSPGIDNKHLLDISPTQCDSPIQFVVQNPPKGTGDAVLCTQPVFNEFDGSILVLCGDVPLLTTLTLNKLIKLHQAKGAVATILTAVVPDPSSYGRIVREGNEVMRIVEEADASQVEKEISEVNTGIYVFEKAPLFDALHKVKPSNAQREFYLTDTIEILRKMGLKICAFKVDDYHETIGINTKAALAEVESILQSRGWHYLKPLINADEYR